MSNPTDLEEASRIRVLLVDDHEAFLRAVTDFLRRHDELAVVGVAYGGEEALAQAQSLQPQVILVDLNMPGLSGLETISRLRVMLPEVGIVALTLLDPSTYRQAALAVSANEFISKANLSSDLLPAIRQAAKTVWPGKNARLESKSCVEEQAMT
jgi:two-component system nitrate/nitrite response regulator NarL